MPQDQRTEHVDPDATILGGVTHKSLTPIEDDQQDRLRVIRESASDLAHVAGRLSVEEDWDRAIKLIDWLKGHVDEIERRADLDSYA